MLQLQIKEILDRSYTNSIQLLLNALPNVVAIKLTCIKLKAKILQMFIKHNPVELILVGETVNSQTINTRSNILAQIAIKKSTGEIDELNHDNNEWISLYSLSFLKTGRIQVMSIDRMRSLQYQIWRKLPDSLSLLIPDDHGQSGKFVISFVDIFCNRANTKLIHSDFKLIVNCERYITFELLSYRASHIPEILSATFNLFRTIYYNVIFSAVDNPQNGDFYQIFHGLPFDVIKLFQVKPIDMISVFCSHFKENHKNYAIETLSGAISNEEILLQIPFVALKEKMKQLKLIHLYGLTVWNVQLPKGFQLLSDDSRCNQVLRLTEKNAPKNAICIEIQERSTISSFTTMCRRLERFSKMS